MKGMANGVRIGENRSLSRAVKLLLRCARQGCFFFHPDLREMLTGFKQCVKSSHQATHHVQNLTKTTSLTNSK
jgi:hypothetical protein